MRGVIPPLPNTSSWRVAYVKQRDKFIFHLLSEENDEIFKQKNVHCR